MNSFEPDWCDPPCNTILDIIYEKRLTTIDFAIKMDMSFADVIYLLTDTLRIDDNISDKLSSVLGNSKEFWLNREKRYINFLRNKDE